MRLRFERSEGWEGTAWLYGQRVSHTVGPHLLLFDESSSHIMLTVPIPSGRLSVTGDVGNPSMLIVTIVVAACHCVPDACRDVV